MTSDSRSLTSHNPSTPSNRSLDLSTTLSELTLKYSDCPDNCPPSTAHKGPKELFRVVANKPLTHDDFLTCHELNKHHDADACLRCSLSTYSSQAHAERLKKDIPFFKRHMIASGIVPVHGGVMKKTTSRAGHWSWWPANGYQRHITFAIVA